MRKQLIENAAFEVATQVRSVEEAIDCALAEIAELQGRMMRARAVANVGPATGHEAIEHLADALKGLVKARGEMLCCHGVLREAQEMVPGIRTTAMGEGDRCPPQRASAELRAVA